MTLTFKINSLVGRIALAITFLLLGVILVVVNASHFVIRTVADRRLSINQEALTMAAAKLPGSSRIQFRLAEAELEAQKFTDAQTHAEQAVKLSPWDYRNWRLLAAAQDFDGKSEEAERSVLSAVKLAPSFFEINWTAANLLLRQGKLQDAVTSFRVATRTKSEILPTAFELLWQASNGDIEPLKSLASKGVSSQLVLTQFLGEQSNYEAAVSIYRNIDAEAKLKSPSAAAFISSLIKENRKTVARELWLDTASKSIKGEHTDALIWNGGFEFDLPREFNHFDWVLSPSNYARIGFDRGVAHGGNRSLKLAFAGRDTTKIEGEIKQLVILKPNVRYRLDCYAKTGNLVTPEGPRLALLGANGPLAVSSPVGAGSNDWQNLMVEFIAPAEAVMTYIAIVRIPRFSYDEPTQGTVWFDDFKLVEL